MRSLLILSLFGVLFLTSCGGPEKIAVTDTGGRQVGEILLEDDDNATIASVNGETRGKVRGNLVRNDMGKRAGTIEKRDGVIVLVDAENSEVGSIEKGSECYGKSQTMLGSVKGEVDVDAVGAACMLLLLPKE
jgi:hypothetical protein